VSKKRFKTPFAKKQDFKCEFKKPEYEIFYKFLSDEIKRALSKLDKEKIKIAISNNIYDYKLFNFPNKQDLEKIENSLKSKFPSFYENDKVRFYLAIIHYILEYIKEFFDKEIKTYKRNEFQKLIINYTINVLYDKFNIVKSYLISQINRILTFYRDIFNKCKEGIFTVSDIDFDTLTIEPLRKFTYSLIKYNPLYVDENLDALVKNILKKYTFSVITMKSKYLDSESASGFKYISVSDVSEFRLSSDLKVNPAEHIRFLVRDVYYKDKARKFGIDDINVLIKTLYLYKIADFNIFRYLDFIQDVICNNLFLVKDISGLYLDAFYKSNKLGTFENLGTITKDKVIKKLNIDDKKIKDLIYPFDKDVFESILKEELFLKRALYLSKNKSELIQNISTYLEKYFNKTIFIDDLKFSKKLRLGRIEYDKDNNIYLLKLKQLKRRKNYSNSIENILAIKFANILSKVVR